MGDIRRPTWRPIWAPVTCVHRASSGLARPGLVWPSQALEARRLSTSDEDGGAGDESANKWPPGLASASRGPKY